MPSTRRAPRRSSREHAPCRACCPEHALGHEAAGSGSTLEASERVFSVPVSCHVWFLLLESVLAGRVGPAGSGHVPPGGCSLDILARPLQTNAKPIRRQAPWLDQPGRHRLPQKRGSNLLAFKMASPTRPALGPRVPLCELEGTLAGQTQPHGTADCHVGHRWNSAFTAVNNLYGCSRWLCPRPQLRGQSPPTLYRSLLVRGCRPRLPLHVRITPHRSQVSRPKMKEAELNTPTYTQPTCSEAQDPTPDLAHHALVPSGGR